MQARVEVYKVCWLGGCFTFGIVVGINKAIEGLTRQSWCRRSRYGFPESSGSGFFHECIVHQRMMDMELDKVLSKCTNLYRHLFLLQQSSDVLNITNFNANYMLSNVHTSYSSTTLALPTLLLWSSFTAILIRRDPLGVWVWEICWLSQASLGFLGSQRGSWFGVVFQYICSLKWRQWWFLAAIILN